MRGRGVADRAPELPGKLEISGISRQSEPTAFACPTPCVRVDFGLFRALGFPEVRPGLDRALPYMRLRLLPAVLVALLAPAAGAAQDAGSGTSTQLLPGDVINVDIWREEELSGQFQVDENGVVVLPLLGRKTVTGISADDLRDQLIEGYGEYLVNPAVLVVLLRRVNVLGEVTSPGVYLVDATQSIADLIARAQGIKPDGNADDIRLVRNGVTTRADLTGSLSIQDAGIRSGDQIWVGKRSWFSRNFSSVVGIASIIANIVVIARN